MDLDTGLALIEREPELAALERAIAGRGDSLTGRFVLVRGDAGLGKTALLRAAHGLARRHGRLAFTARSSEIEQGFSFGIVRQLIEPWLRNDERDARRRLATGPASLAGAVFPSMAGGAASGEVDFATLHGLYWLLASLAAERALAMTIDDLQWADLPSLRFVQFLLRRVEGLDLVLIASQRTRDPSPTAAIIGELVEELVTQVLTLAPLTAAGVARLLEDMTGRTEPELARHCRTASGGNPLYAAALIEQLSAEPELSLTSDRSVGPVAVVRSVEARLSRLGGDARALAEAAAILGPHDELGHAAQLAGLCIDAARGAARALAGASILESHEALGFVHPVVRAAVLEPLEARTREQRHASAARLLQANDAPRERIAAHVLRTAPGMVDGAPSVLLAAADNALERGAPEIAAEFLERALEESDGALDRAQLLLMLAQAEIRAGRPAALEHLKAARDAAGDQAGRVQATLLLARGLYLAGEAEQALDLLISEERALSCTAPELAGAVEAELLTLADVDLAVRPRVRDRLERIMARSAGSDGLSAEMSAHLAVAGLMDGRDARDATRRAEAALADGQLMARALLGDQLFLLMLLVLTLAEALDAADRHSAALIAAARASGSAPAVASASNQRAILALYKGDLFGAEAGARDALAVAEVNRWRPLAQMVLTPLLHVMVERGEAPRARAGAATVGIDLDHLDAGTQATVLLEARGRLRLEDGQLQAGVDDLLTVGARLEGWGVLNPAPFPWRTRAALGLAALAKTNEAAALAERDLEHAERWGTSRAIGMSLRARGRAASGAEQIRWFEDAVGVLRGSPARLELAHALGDLGAALRRANRRADARAPLHEALELAMGCGATPLAHRIHTELRATGARPRSPLRTGVDALTPSELRIAEMAASGLSDTRRSRRISSSPSRPWRRTCPARTASWRSPAALSSRRPRRETVEPRPRRSPCAVRRRARRRPPPGTDDRRAAARPGRHRRRARGGAGAALASPDGSRRRQGCAPLSAHHGAIALLAIGAARSSARIGGGLAKPVQLAATNLGRRAQEVPDPLELVDREALAERGFQSAAIGPQMRSACLENAGVTSTVTRRRSAELDTRRAKPALSRWSSTPVMAPLVSPDWAASSPAVSPPLFSMMLRQCRSVPLIPSWATARLSKALSWLPLRVPAVPAAAPF